MFVVPVGPRVGGEVVIDGFTGLVGPLVPIRDAGVGRIKAGTGATAVSGRLDGKLEIVSVLFHTTAHGVGHSLSLIHI